MLWIIVLLEDDIAGMNGIAVDGPYKRLEEDLDEDMVIHCSSVLMKFSDTP